MTTINDSIAFRNRGRVGFILLLPLGAALSFSYPLIVEDSFLDITMDTLGWLLFCLYVTFRIWATLYVGGRKDIKLQTKGPYSMTRNPLYFGSLCFALSTAFFLKSIFLVLMISVVCVIYLNKVIKAEETLLENRFGEQFRKYYRRTPRFLPSLSLYRGDDSVEVNLRAIIVEAKRLWVAVLVPIGVEIIMHLRMAAWWPHWFVIP